MESIETVVELLFCAILLALIARRARIPYPVALVIGGLLLAFVPGPPVILNPDLALTLFLPPVLYQAALDASWRDTRQNLGSISLLATGLVVFTTTAVAAVAHFLVPGMGWAPGFVLGAIVSPSDAVAATAVMQRLSISRRIVTVVEGESLVNDATGLVFYKYSIAAVVAGTFSFPEAAADFLLIGGGGVAIGLAFGWIFVKLQRGLNDPLIESTYSLLLPFAIYITAQYVGVSGVLAVVAAGLVRGHYYPEILSARTRVQALLTWDVVIFILNSLSFVLIGLQLRGLMPWLMQHSALTMIGVPVAISAVVILTRIVWVFSMGYAASLFSKPAPNPRSLMVVAWTGMRGIVSLATALALPVEIVAGREFPYRNLIVFTAFSVILATLVIQGLTLGPLIRLLGLHADNTTAREEAVARLEAAKAALVALAKLPNEATPDRRALHRLRSDYERRIADLHGTSSTASAPVLQFVQTDAQFRSLRVVALAAERTQIVAMRNRSIIGDEVLHRIERELDLEELEIT